MDMLIVESGAKSKTIQKYLGKGWIVAACNGHVQDLPTDRKSKDGKKAMWVCTADTLPEPPWQWTDNAERTVSNMLRRAGENDVENVYLATDPDREGEFIAWRLSEIFGDAGYPNVWRVTFNEITKKAVMAAIELRGDVNSNLVDAAKVRRYMDRLVGFRASKFSQSWSLTSMGRVQTPTLGFIVERELERDAFVPQPYFAVSADVQGVRFNVRFHEKDDALAWVDDKGKHNPLRTAEGDLAKSAHAALVKQRELSLREVTSGTRNNRPYPPFSTDTLLQSAGVELSWNPRRAMKVASELYNAGHITYIRTDSTRTSSSARESVKKFIAETWGEDHVGGGVVGKDAGAKNVQDAHEAIRPTSPGVRMPEGLGEPQQRLYRLVWARFTGSQMTPSRYENYSFVAECEGCKKPLTGTTSWRVHAGWEAAFAEIRKQPATTPPEFKAEVGVVLGLDDADENPTFTEDETKPPSRYKQHSIVQKMKEKGIGRPSTFATTIDKLIKRKYCKDDSGTLIPTNDGRTLWLEVAPFYDRAHTGGEGNLFSSAFTAEMELNLDSIEGGSLSAATSWNDFSSRFQAIHLNALEKKKEHPTRKQLAYFGRLTEGMPEDELSALTDNRGPEALSGSEIAELLSKLTTERPLTNQPASEKQLNWVASLTKDADLTEQSACELVGVAGFDKLTGGREGSASGLIDILLTRQKETDRPASDKQINWIMQLAEKASLDEKAACALVQVDDWSSLTGGRGGSASSLITLLRKRSPTSGRKRGRRKSK